MKTINIPRLQNAWAGLKMKYPAKITKEKLCLECKALKISLTSKTMPAYIKAGVLTRVSHGVYIIDSTPNKIVVACDEATNNRKKYTKKTVERAVFNATVEAPAKLTPEMAIKYLKNRGYFIYLPKRGEKITITLSF